MNSNNFWRLLNMNPFFVSYNDYYCQIYGILPILFMSSPKTVALKLLLSVFNIRFSDGIFVKTTSQAQLK